MEIIYEPKGAAREYAALALNIYTTCSHGCKYCYAPKVLRKTREEFFRSGGAPRKNLVKRLEKDARALAEKGDCPEILISFIGDPFQPGVSVFPVLEATRVLIDHGLPFTFLTKAPSRAATYFKWWEGYSRIRFGVTLTLLDEEDLFRWEPEADSFRDRAVALQNAKAAGFKTWVSLEPVIDPAQALSIIRRTSHLVDHWKVGKMNHYPEIESRVNWAGFLRDVTYTLENLNASYYIKKSLARFSGNNCPTARA